MDIFVFPNQKQVLEEYIKQTELDKIFFSDRKEKINIKSIEAFSPYILETEEKGRKLFSVIYLNDGIVGTNFFGDNDFSAKEYMEKLKKQKQTKGKRKNDLLHK